MAFLLTRHIICQSARKYRLRENKVKEKMSRLQFIGGGNIAKALLKGLLNAKWVAAEELAVIIRRPESRAELEKSFPGVQILEAPLNEVDAILAVKPADVAAALAGLVDCNIDRLISVVAGINSTTLESGLGDTTRVVRVMPNTPSKIGFGAAGIAGGSTAADEDLKWAETILSSVGVAVKVTEDLMDAVTGLSGSGTGFALYFAEALQEAGIQLGLDSQSVDILVGHTLLGAAQMLLAGEFSAAELRQQVASPNGTTEAGIKALQEGEFLELVQKAVKRAAERAKEIATEYE